MSRDHDAIGRGTELSATPRNGRRLSDKILVAFDHACATKDIEVADRLLRILEAMLARRTVTPDRRRQQNRDSLVTAYEQLWRLRHPDLNDLVEGDRAAHHNR